MSVKNIGKIKSIEFGVKIDESFKQLMAAFESAASAVNNFLLAVNEMLKEAGPAFDEFVIIGNVRRWHDARKAARNPWQWVRAWHMEHVWLARLYQLKKYGTRLSYYDRDSL